MTYVDGLGAANYTQNQGQAATLGGMGSEAFLQLLVAQMRYQDPMSPADHTAMLQQTSQFTQVETLQQVSLLQQQLLGLSQAGIASEMIGKEVVAATEAGAVTGVVEGVRFTAAGPMLDVGTHEVPLQAATAVRLPGGDPTVAFVADAPSAAAGDVWAGPWFHDDGASNAAVDPSSS